ncbi:MAG TPA: methylmalonyl Co-A mutase-associated GTPase MeaB [Candidatus Competibacter sp.]|nr:methylmalonyl Co-A mutase-associated GTPase MeaB [Candidatus Competibacteraceae bacterium]HRE54951.1 methylmalonyl Co-A mutase-associated GTPase MeaB [Candidatus Competibacter sp.]HUM92922.1 methylmalonyl Co-A mutase-associated GTPase MeaB [Candidatus Competibacter sp.]
MSLALPEPESLAAAVSGRDRLALAQALNLLDDRRPAARQRAAAFLDALPPEKLCSGGHLIGITGPPGAGKSSLTASLIQVWRRRGLKVAILAVDPSSPVTGGALLGDRLRMHASGADREVFIRSLACRGEFGGLSAEVWPMSLAMLAAFDIVLVETVGVGQKEIDVSKMTDTTCFVAQPASGDSIQFLKAGIMEVPHVIVVNKEDIGMAARKTLSELKNTLRRQLDPEGWQVPALSASAALGSGIETLADALDAHRVWLLKQGRFTARRQRCQAEWLVKHLREEFGRYGLGRLGGEEALFVELAQAPRRSPIAEYEALRSRVLDAIKTQP